MYSLLRGNRRSDQDTPFCDDFSYLGWLSPALSEDVPVSGEAWGYLQLEQLEVCKVAVGVAAGYQCLHLTSLDAGRFPMPQSPASGCSLDNGIDG